jgi:hypothetical protein
MVTSAVEKANDLGLRNYERKRGKPNISILLLRIARDHNNILQLTFGSHLLS